MEHPRERARRSGSAHCLSAPLDEPVPDLNIYGHLLEAKAQIGDVIATPRHEGMDMISILIVSVCIEN